MGSAGGLYIYKYMYICIYIMEGFKGEGMEFGREVNEVKGKTQRRRVVGV